MHDTKKPVTLLLDGAPFMGNFGICLVVLASADWYDYILDSVVPVLHPRFYFKIYVAK